MSSQLLRRVPLSAASRLPIKFRAGPACRHLPFNRTEPRSNRQSLLRLIVAPNDKYITIRSFFRQSTTMSENSNADNGDAQHDHRPSSGPVAVAVTATGTDTKHRVDEQENKNQDSGEDTKALPSPADDGGNGSRQTAPNKGCGKTRKQNKASRWKQMHKKKKEQKRKKIEEFDEKNNTKRNKWKVSEEDKEPEGPHEGSFAHETMQKLFNVTVKVPPGGDNGTVAEVEKVPKKKIAILVSFLGSDYAGFQINAEKRTLQAELELGLHRAGIISKSNFGHPRKYGWSNSARTDKGVHAAAQCCSLKGELIFHNVTEDVCATTQWDAMREEVNKHLPEDVRILDVRRVTQMFCARTGRDKVRYQYMMPSYMLCSPEEVRAAFPTGARMADGSHTPSADGGDDDGGDGNLDPAAVAQARRALVGHRATAEQLERLKRGLKLFEGTHSFHNYTRRVGAKDASATRYILSFAPLDPLIVPGEHAAQWIPLQVVGQSFLLNQIRKMVSAAADFARGTISEKKIKESLRKQCCMKVNVAPAQGLFLDRSFFELYNKHKVKNAPKHGDNHKRDTLDWVEIGGEEMPPAVRRIEEFKNEKIIPHIIEQEVSEGNFLKHIYAHNVLYNDGIYNPIEDVVKSNLNQDVDNGVASNVV